MKRVSACLFLVALSSFLAGWTPRCHAYSRYNDGCQTCHGAFTGTASMKPGNTWPSNLHDVHRNSMLNDAGVANSRCNICHLTGDNRNPYTWKSDGTANMAKLGCLGCHGRSEGGAVTGAGLRAHHAAKGATVCADCHSDGTPVAENVVPPYYGKAGCTITSPCNGDGKENWTSDGLGLDNDGNLLVDGNDPSCGQVCSYTINPASQSFQSTSGTGSISITTTAGCGWTAVSNINWATITLGSAGTGNGSVTYSVGANVSSLTRLGTLTVATKTFTLTQAGVACTFAILPINAAYTSAGGSGSVSVTSPGGCAWTATETLSWATITSGSSGSGNGTVAYTVGSNAGTLTRTGTMTIAGNTFTLTESGVAADLLVQTLTANKVTYGASEVGTATVTIKNQGATSTGVIYYTSVYQDAPANVDSTTPYFNRAYRSPLAAGATDTFTIWFQSPGSNGSYTLRVFTDHNVLIPETDETNNQGTVSYSVLISPADLLVQTLTPNKATYAPGEIGTATVAVSNQGGTNTGVVYYTSLYQDAPANVGSATPYFNRTYRLPIAAGAIDTFTIWFKAPSSNGSYTLRAFTDYNALVSESNETNNQGTANYSVLAPPADLLVQTLTTNKASYSASEVGTATVVVKNQGGTSTGVIYYTSLYQDAPANVGSTTPYFNRAYSPYPLAAGGTDTYTIWFRAPSNNGTYTLRVFTDYNVLVAESDETNNQATSSYSVTGGILALSAALPLPDLVVQSVALNKTSYGPGEKGIATITIKNQGNASTGAGFAVDLFRNALAPVDCAPSDFYTRSNRPALAAGATDTFTVEFVNYVAEGGFVLGVFADSTCVLFESNEANNQATTAYSVKVPSAPTITNGGTPNAP